MWGWTLASPKKPQGQILSAWPRTRAPGGRGSVAEPKGVPIPRLAAGEGSRTQDHGDLIPPSPSAPTTPGPSRHPSGNADRARETEPREPAGSTAAALTPLGARVRFSGVRTKASAPRGRSEQTKPALAAGPPRGRSEGAGGTDPGPGDQSLSPEGAGGSRGGSASDNEGGRARRSSGGSALYSPGRGGGGGGDSSDAAGLGQGS
ncbi:unnamed protein product [Rangifer tarandus platyrhynchus]|uniref:Uncharacterized protein n=2 Tax=Rangifer tarandus platyrhynchus TaxID=3082113 RepID=A0ACB0FIC9_RANTA|nr:unnamed protein product [Rangifer tarandus platyrhynchus]CAI9711766.1 unnamed protein product [Rangifer tarandus platyrhynchus]